MCRWPAPVPFTALALACTHVFVVPAVRCWARDSLRETVDYITQCAQACFPSTTSSPAQFQSQVAQFVQQHVIEPLDRRHRLAREQQATEMEEAHLIMDELKHELCVAVTLCSRACLPRCRLRLPRACSSPLRGVPVKRRGLMLFPIPSYTALAEGTELRKGLQRLEHEFTAASKHPERPARVAEGDPSRLCKEACHSLQQLRAAFAALQTERDTLARRTSEVSV